MNMRRNVHAWSCMMSLQLKMYCSCIGPWTVKTFIKYHEHMSVTREDMNTMGSCTGAPCLLEEKVRKHLHVIVEHPSCRMMKEKK